MDEAEARARVERAQVAHLGTVMPSGRPHLVPCCFVLHGDRLYSAVDRKPKSTLELARLANIERNPAVTLLVDHYEEDWAKLWWVRVDGDGHVVHDDDERRRALSLLGDKYAPYRDRAPIGHVIALGAHRWSWWEATPS